MSDGGNGGDALTRHDRVRQNSLPSANAAIDRQMELAVQAYASQPGAAIDERIRQLEDEWDIERMLEANAATLALAGVGLAAASSKKWLWLPAVVTAFLIQHAIQGWCPPLLLFRRLGVRTRREIEAEKQALKALRGDFQAVPTNGTGTARARAALEAARA